MNKPVPIQRIEQTIHVIRGQRVIPDRDLAIRYGVTTNVKLREMLGAQHALAQKLTELERQVASHDNSIRSLFDAIRQLMAESEPKSSRIGRTVLRAGCRRVCGPRWLVRRSRISVYT